MFEIGFQFRSGFVQCYGNGMRADFERRRDFLVRLLIKEMQRENLRLLLRQPRNGATHFYLELLFAYQVLWGSTMVGDRLMQALLTFASS